jgi:transposase
MHVKEYRAEILIDTNGVKFTADFPEGITQAAQYGNEVKAQAVYMSIFQMIPLDRILDYFKEQAKLIVSKGSISNFKTLAYNKLIQIGFDTWVSLQLLNSEVNHADETGINVNGKRIWLHSLSNEKYVLYHPDKKRGKDAMDNMGILENFKGVLCHDHWKPYFKFEKCKHSLCNAHHRRELKRAYEQDEQDWAKEIYDLLDKMNDLMKSSGRNILTNLEITDFKEKYRSILEKGKQECSIPKPPPDQKVKKRGKIKKSKSRNLLERLIDYEDETLGFMSNAATPFTNNMGENDLRMTKVQQKISGCFRSMDGAKEFCLIRSYIVTAKKQGMGASKALRLLFTGKKPGFMM